MPGEMRSGVSAAQHSRVRGRMRPRYSSGLKPSVHDLGYGARSLRSNPLVSTVAILSIALAIGASTAIFSVVHAVLLNALPYQDPDRIVILWGTDKVNNSIENNTSVPNFEDWRKRTQDP